MKLVFSGTSPWSNPSLTVYQHEFNQVYSLLQYRLHGDDAVVMPVTILSNRDIGTLTFPTPQTNRDLGILRNQIGAEALMAVIEFLPTQYDKRALDSKSKRAAYISTLLNSKQRPFIWEYFRPGTIEIPRGEEQYYDEVSLPLLLHTGSLEMSYSRNAEARSSQFLSFVPSRYTSRRTGSRCDSRPKRLDTQSVHSHSQQLQ